MCSSIQGTFTTSGANSCNGSRTAASGSVPGQPTSDPDSPAVVKYKNVISLRRRTIYVFYFMAFLDLLAVSLFLPILNSALRDLGATPFMAGLIGSTYGAIQLISSPVMGWGSDIYGTKLVMLISLVATALAYIVQGLAFNISLMLMARVVAGVFKHTQTVGKSLVSELSTKDKSYVIGNFNAFGSIGFIIGPTAGAHIAQLDNGFQLVSFISAAAFLLNGILLIALVPDPSRLTSKSPVRSTPASESSADSSSSKLMAVVRNADAHSLIMLAVRFLFSFATLVCRENLTIILQEKYSSDLVNSGYLTSLQALMGTVMGFAVGPVNAFAFRGNPLYMVLFMGILKTGVLFTLYLSSTYWLASGLLIVVSALNPFLRVGITAVSLENHQDIGAILGLSQSATSLARMISPTAAGVALGMSTDGPFLVAGVSSILGIFATLIAHRYAHRPSHKVPGKVD